MQLSCLSINGSSSSAAHVSAQHTANWAQPGTHTLHGLRLHAGKVKGLLHEGTGLHGSCRACRSPAATARMSYTAQAHNAAAARVQGITASAAAARPAASSARGG